MGELLGRKRLVSLQAKRPLARKIPHAHIASARLWRVTGHLA
jgi:hypothetical protein